MYMYVCVSQFMNMQTIKKCKIQIWTIEIETVIEMAL